MRLFNSSIAVIFHFSLATVFANDIVKYARICPHLSTVSEPETLPYDASDFGVNSKEFELATKFEVNEKGFLILKKWHIVSGCYVVRAKLGTGAQGIVYSAVDMFNSKKLVALKIINCHASQDPYKNEIRVLNRLRKNTKKGVSNKHVVGLLNDLTYRGFKVLVFPFFNSHDLAETIIAKKRWPFSQFQSLVKQLVDGLAFIHSRGVVHLDIKPDNIAIDSKGDEQTFAWLDFGLSKFVGNNIRACGTVEFMSPDLIFPSRITAAADMWSLGLVIYVVIVGEQLGLQVNHNKDFSKLIAHHYTIAFGRPPAEWHRDRANDAFFKEARTLYRKVPMKAPEFPIWRKRFVDRMQELGFTLEQRLQTWHFLMNCLQWLPQRRISASQALSHPLLSIQ